MKALSARQQSVYACLKNSTTPQGAYELLECLRTDGFKAPTQIYRALNSLITLGLVHKVDSLNAFVACTENHHQGTSIIAICDQCNSYQELSSETLDTLFKNLPNDRDFKARQMTIELKGSCSECA